MAKTSKKALGAAMAGVMAIGAVAGTVGSLDQVKVANAAESQAQKDAKAKISHTIYSINKNYAGIKNQAQWEIYIKEAKALIAKMPTAEAEIAAELTKQVDGLADTVLAIARINQVEKSYEANFHGIKNAAQWREYLDLAKEDMKSVDQTVFAAKYEELVKRYNVASDNVKAIEDAYAVELADATKLYDAAVKSMNLADAEKALAAAEALGTHATSDKLEADCKALIAKIKEEPAVESVSAINAEEVLVTFNKEVTASAAEKVNYEISKNGNKDSGTTAIKDIKVSGRTALIRLNVASKEGDKYVIQTNDAIVSKEGKAFPRYASPEYTYKNGAVASLQKVDLNAAADKLTLTFDRPVANGTSTDVTLIKVDGIDITSKQLTKVVDKAGNYQYDVALSGVTAEQLKAFKAEGSHEVVIFDVKDTASANAVNNSVVTGTYTVTKDTAAPTVVSVKALNANKFFVETNRTVDLTSATLKVEKGVHEFVKGNVNSDYSKMDYAVGTHDGKPGIYVVVTDSNPNGLDENPLYKGAESSVSLKVSLENYKANDLVGAKYVGNITLNKDATKPEVKSTALDAAGNKLSVTFKEKLVAAPAAADVIVRDKDGVVIPANDITTSLKVGDNSTVEFAVTSGIIKDDKAPYTVEFKAEKIQYADDRTSVVNYIVKSLKNDKITATVRSSETGFKYKAFSELGGTGNSGTVSMNNNVIKVDYKTEMTDSARQVSNYKLDGKALPAGSTVDFVGSKNVIEIALPEGSIKTTTGYKLTIATDVTTKAGEHVVKDLQTKAEYEKVVQLIDNTKPELKSAVYVVADNNATATNKIKITFNEDLATLNGTDAAKNLKIVINNSEQTGFTVVDAKPGDAELEITLSSAVAISQAATISIVADNAGKVNITDKSTVPNEAKVGSTVVANQKELDIAGALDLQAVNTAKANLALNPLTPTEATSTITLPATQDGTTVTYKIKKQTSTAIAGSVGDVLNTSVTTEARGADAKVTVIEATITKGSATVTQLFTVTVGNDTQTTAPAYDNANTVVKN